MKSRGNICLLSLVLSSIISSVRSFQQGYHLVFRPTPTLQFWRMPPYTSKSLLRESINPSTDNINTDQVDQDRRTVVLHLFSCITTAVSLVSYENYDCANLKPQQASLRRNSVEGLGYGKTNRVEGKMDFPVGDGEDGSLWDVPSYNEIMLQHRSDTVPRWRKQQDETLPSSSSTSTSTSTSLSISSSTASIENAVDVLYQSLLALLELKLLANDYEWDEMRIVLTSSTLNEDLETACTLLRVALYDTTNNLGTLVESNPKNIIGFDWGSCAWRHCGALADIQEAVAELRNSLGLFEPFECLFAIDIAERSLRDILSIVPAKYKQMLKIPEYDPYLAQVSYAFFFLFRVRLIVLFGCLMVVNKSWMLNNL